MTQPYNGGARSPKPLGFAPGTLGGRIPGPLGFQHKDVAKGQGATRATKSLTMPPPAGGSTAIIQARSISWPLSKDDTPRMRDVQQGELAICPVAAILAALANTASGIRRLNNLITEYRGTTVKTTFSPQALKTLAAKMADDPDYHAPASEIPSTRYFTVVLGNAIEVSDVFYVKYSDGTDADLIYMRGLNEALWPCVIEKAYAAKIGSYEELDDDSKHTVNEFWEVLVGSKPGGFAIDEKTDLTKIRDAAQAARRIPTIGASRDDATKVTAHHGFAIVGLQGATIELYDPYGKTVRLSLTDFRSSFKAIFFGNP